MNLYGSNRAFHWKTHVKIACICAILLIGFCTTGALGQSDVGSIVGFVKDQSGAVVPGAHVTVQNEGTGEARTVTSDAQGHYTVPDLPPAVYSVTAELSGFQKFSSVHNRLASNTTISIDAQLAVGQETQTIEVSDTETVLQTQSGSVQAEVTGEQVDKQELNGRNPLYMAQLSPGVFSTTTMGDFNFAFNSGDSFEVNGARQNDTRYTLDDAPAARTRADSQIIAGANTDAVQEIQVLTADYSAEYGSASGAQIRVITKSGTKDFHGTAYEYLRNSAMNANTWTRNLTPSTQFTAPFVYNNFGFSVGGPVWAPKVPVLDKLRDKFFFFVNEDWIRYRYDTPQTMAVPTALMRQGNFSELLSSDSTVNPWYKPTQIYYPGTCPKVGAATCVPIPNNDIADNAPQLLSANGLGILNSYPAPTPGFLQGTSNYDGSLPDPINQRKGQINGDLLITPVHHLEFRRSDDSYYQLSPFNQSNPQVPIVYERPNQTDAVGWVWTVSPTMINEARASVSIDDVYISAAPGGAGYDRSSFGINFPYILPGLKAQENKIPTANLNDNFSNIAGGPYPSHSSGLIFVASDSVTKVWGNHTLKGGFSLTYMGENDNDQINVSTVPGGASNQNGTFGFTDNHNNLGATSGASIANLALGLSDSYTEIGPKAFTEWRGWTFEYFAQDSWQVTPKLHLDYGLRITNVFPPFAQWANATFFDPASYDPATAPYVSPTTGNVTLGTGNPYDGVVIPGFSSFPGSATQNNRVPAATASNDECAGQPCTGLFAPNLPKGYVNTTVQVQPRVGIAYQLFPRTVIRAGAGRFISNKGLLDNIFPGGNSPFQPTVTVTNVSVDNPGASLTPTVEPPITLTTLNNHLVPPTRWNWNLTVEHELRPLQSVFQVAYVGARGLHNWDVVDINQPAVGAQQANPGVQLAALRPYKGFASIQQEQSGVSSTYDALQASWTTRFRSGSSIGAAYTYSKSMDSSSNYRDIVPDSYNTSNLWGPSEYDVRHVLIVNGLYALPFFKNEHNLAGETLGGWQLSGNVQAQTGTPCGIGTNTDYAGVGEVGSFGCGSEGEFYVKNGNPKVLGHFAGAAATGAAWFATTNSDGSKIFTAPTAGTFNLQGGIRDEVYQPGLQNWNLAMIKAFPVTEGTGFEFRAEAFNFINHPNLAGPNLNPTSSQFGLVTGKTTSNPRTLQVGLRFHY
ncbi:Plug and carboxypeptidase regulatory-like domain-containing protein [Acidicapsa dinghuensis]|uniref:Plug and carboxypeptidase regulatory-like domain-containing protein n=1 Tax=Acidicapsa dinghuensis TaxID=2218256 RepID=A0ABW1EHN0_9BACT|nr:Plug and carboxypeptidase regulatory-like domain-containing protein [Acidicapsa dinghuensis]